MSFPCAPAASLDVSESLCVLDDHTGKRIHEGCPQSVSDPPTHCIGAAGVLRYNRESDNHRLNLTTIPPASQPSSKCSVKCEYCGEKARPSLDLTWVEEFQAAALFCCAQRQQLCKMLVKQRFLIEGRCDLGTSNLTSEEEKPTTEMEELLLQGKEMEDHNKFIVDLANALGEQSELRIEEEYLIQLPLAQTFAPTSKVLSFRLSCAPGNGCWTNSLKIKEKDLVVPFCDHNALQFGLCHHQDVGGFLQKHYSNGMKFLTMFPDGSAQVFYPSGLLALVIVVTKENGRVCIVYDDSQDPDQPIRAVFQSDGRATCYYSNGNIWLTLDRLGGQCLDETGARVRRWSWSSLSLSPTPLHPVFLSLNKTVGVRVLGKEQVFVSFLASGQQAKFSVGTCCAQCKCTSDGPVSGPSVLKEELLVLAARIKLHLVIRHLHQNLMAPSNPRLPKTTLAPSVHVFARRLLEVSTNVMMSESEKAFICRCLQDCV
ncbi:glutamate-rich protein 6 isoform X1 [Thunnus maccoyii]|uniref:glutamate-rich protein 6 isoform X1 n=1 Tax=Thunnus maccoyii TaxID=8240 RepID=UPI001C4B5709|nr:glutamate-rich protein 6 isoform X1 [Thunnus maccoyii]XP_042283669.1 glutamate-rich protein 6 isoform X1 [Thunnus maccoyii]XP_042283670.1 glutamate-rich protein 6 isoform X1 [Thunnus maccoyii]